MDYSFNICERENDFAFDSINKWKKHDLILNFRDSSKQHPGFSPMSHKKTATKLFWDYESKQKI